MKKSIVFLLFAMFSTSLFAQVPQYQRRQVASQWFMRDVKVGGTLTAGKYVTPTDTVALLKDVRTKLAIADTASLVATKSDLSKLPISSASGVSQEQFDTTLYRTIAPPVVGSVNASEYMVFYVVKPTDSNYKSSENQWYETNSNPDDGVDNWYNALEYENYASGDLQFHLPTKYELNLMYNERELLQLYYKDKLGVLVSNWDSIYWSSTVDNLDTTKAWAQNFNTGAQFVYPKDSLLGQTYCAIYKENNLIEKYATTSSLNNYATTSSLNNYATTSSLNNYVCNFNPSNKNLIQNSTCDSLPFFEGGRQTTSSCTVSFSSDHYLSANKSMKLDGTYDTYYQMWLDPLLLGIPYGVYTFSAWVYVPSGEGTQLSDVYISAYRENTDGSGRVSSITEIKSNIPTAYDQWQLLSVTDSVSGRYDDNGLLVNFFRIYHKGNNVQRTLYIDNMRFEAGNKVTNDGINASSVHSFSYSISALNTPPASATDAGTTGEIRICASYIYVCVATNTWVRTALTSW